MDLKEIVDNTKRHPWELSRAERIFSVVKNFKVQFFADVGSGDRFFTKKLLKADAVKIYAVDSGYDKNTVDDERIVCLNDISELKDNSIDCLLIDCLLLMNVLEHIENEKKFLNTSLQKLTSGATVIVTVLAWQFLFSSHDTFVKHYRRYNRRELISLLRNSGIMIKQYHYFYTSLFFVRFLQKVFNLDKKETEGNSEIGSWQHKENSFVTLFVKAILNLDFYINKILDKIFVHFSGLSLIAVCEYRNRYDAIKIQK